VGYKCAALIPHILRAAVCFLLGSKGAWTLAQNSNLDDYERAVHNDTERNTKYHNNADDYPKMDAEALAKAFKRWSSIAER
jgi:hypothetical protein